MKEKSKLILTINTTKRDEIVLGLFHHQFQTKTYQTDDQSADILVFIDQLIQSANLTQNDLTAILVHTGPGSYTGVRVGATVANTLAWTLNIPVFGYVDKNLNQTLITAQKLSSGSGGFKKIALPTY